MSSTISSLQLINYFHFQINKARQDPKSFIPHLKTRRFVKPMEFCHSLLSNVHYQTTEGEAGVAKAIEYLSHQNPCPDLKLSENLCEAAYQMGLQISKLGSHLHQSKKEQLMEKEMLQAGIIQSTQTDIIIEYGFRQDPEIVPSLIVDDGDTNRQIRQKLFNPNHRYIGLSVHQSNEYDYMLIILMNSYTKPKQWCNCSIF